MPNTSAQQANAAGSVMGIVEPSRMASGNFPMPKAPVNNPDPTSRKPALTIAESHRHAFSVVLPWASPTDKQPKKTPFRGIPSPRSTRAELPDSRPSVTRKDTESSKAGPSSTAVPSSRVGVPTRRNSVRSSTPSYVWEIGSQSLPIFDPDYPDETPICNSPRPPPKRDYFEIAALHDAHEARWQALMPGVDLNNLSGIEQREEKLTVSEVCVFGTVGDLEDTFGPELPSLGLCTCGGSRRISRACPLHPGEKEKDHDKVSVRSSRTH
ncbi:hypothetical protein FRB98_003949 [Tulasnella sp. 332]|nr:hypothetical protein FRB98_003949 [Tulasnella sp. 332]